MDKKNQARDKRVSYEDLSEALSSELRFEKMRADSLLSIVSEIKSMTNDPLAKELAQMAIDRYHLDGLIHSRLIFGNE